MICENCYGKGYIARLVYTKPTQNINFNMVVTPCHSCIAGSKCRGALKLMKDQIARDDKGNYGLTNVQLAILSRRLNNE